MKSPDEINWGRWAALAGVLVVLQLVIRGASRVLGIAVDEVFHRAGHSGARFTPGK